MAKKNIGEKDKLDAQNDLRLIEAEKAKLAKRVSELTKRLNEKQMEIDTIHRQVELEHKFGQHFAQLVNVLSNGNEIEVLHKALVHLKSSPESLDYFVNLTKAAISKMGKKNSDDFNEYEHTLEDEIHYRANEDFSGEPGDMAIVKLNDLVSIKQDIMKFKKALRQATDAQGGLVSLAAKTEISAASLSRFFNSEAPPRISTLNKIGNALNITYVYVDQRGKGGEK